LTIKMAKKTTDITELMVRDMVREAFAKGKMFEFILGFRDFWGKEGKNWAEKYEKVVKNEFAKILKET